MKPPRILIKQGVCGDLQPIAQKGYGKVAQLYLDNNCDFIVTAKRDGADHLPGSFHYLGLAFDFDKGPFKKPDIEAVLYKPWQIIEHETHFHAEYDPAQGK